MQLPHEVEDKRWPFRRPGNDDGDDDEDGWPIVNGDKDGDDEYDHADDDDLERMMPTDHADGDDDWGEWRDAPGPDQPATATDIDVFIPPQMDPQPEPLCMSEDTTGEFSFPTDVLEGILSDLKVGRESRWPEANTDVKEGACISLCSVCFGRGPQLQMCMGPNIARLLPHRKYARWLVLLCPDDVGGQPRTDLELEKWICCHYSYYLDSGLLVLVRGTPPSPGYYHASEAKNTAHAAAVTYYNHTETDAGSGGGAPPLAFNRDFKWTAGPPIDDDGRHILVNLDCDNLIGTLFIEDVVSLFGLRVGMTRRLDGIRYKGYDAATTGRVVIAADTFEQLRGYDEEDVYGSGYQDIDLCNRVHGDPSWKYELRTFGKKCKKYESRRVLGYAVANCPTQDPIAAKYERGGAKVINCHNPENLSWGKFNAHNMKVMKARTQEHKWVRNLTRSKPGWNYRFPPVTKDSFVRAAGKQWALDQGASAASCSKAVTAKSNKAARVAAAPLQANAVSGAGARPSGPGSGSGGAAKAAPPPLMPQAKWPSPPCKNSMMPLVQPPAHKAMPKAPPPQEAVPKAHKAKPKAPQGDAQGSPHGALGLIGCRSGLLPGPPPPKVEVTSFGVKHVVRWFRGQGLQVPLEAKRIDAQAKEKGRGGRRGPAISESAISQTVREMRSAMGIVDRHGETTVCFDCRGFNDPGRNHPTGANNHLGSHVRNLDDIVGHADFDALWKKIMQSLAEKLKAPAGRGTHVVVFYCRKGRHRSVSMAWLTCLALRHLGFDVTMSHFMRDFWFGETCDECDECRRQTDRKKQMAVDALHLCGQVHPSL